MALKLSIQSRQRGPLGPHSSIVFGVGGGSIGRARDNDWVLPDPLRYLSSHHARIQFRQGAYYLSDTSTNGVFVNDATVPLGRRSSYPLRHGDRLRLGDYEIDVSIDGEGGESPEASAVFPVHPQGIGGPSELSAPDIGADLNVHDLLRPQSDDSIGLGSLDAFGQPRLTEDTGLLAFDQSGQRQGPARQRTASIERSARAELRAAVGGLESLCRGAGMDAGLIPAEAHNRVLHLAGVLLREALVGLKGLTVAQRALRDDAQIDVGREDPQQIGLSALPVEDLLRRLLLGHEQHELDAVQWLRDTLERARRHDLAVMRALHAALHEFIARLDPAALAEDSDRHADARIESASTGLTARFRSITDMRDERLPHLFAEAFARVFAAEFRDGGPA